MAFVFKYGSYAHDPGELEVSVQTEEVIRSEEMGVRIGRRRVWQLKGMLLADNADIKTRIEEMEAAYGHDGKDAILFREDGTTPTHMQLISSQTVGGVRVLQGPKFPKGDRTEHINLRTYEIVLEAIYEDATAQNVIGFFEVVEFVGGGPRNGHLETLEGLPQKQQLNLATTYRARQSGEAIGRLVYPNPPDLLWPADFDSPSSSIQRRSPRRLGPPGSPQYREWPISWSFAFERNTPFTGFPNLPPG